MITVRKIDELYKNVKQVIEEARETVYRSANITMVQSYWHIGKLIVEEEQNGKERAGYGKELIRNLSEKLSLDFGKGFTETNLKYMRQFYNLFRNSHALRGELSWTHYRLLLKVEKETARIFYVTEMEIGREIEIVEQEKQLKGSTNILICKAKIPPNSMFPTLFHTNHIPIFAKC
jgi:predicted nuclease of restriction endonuclease-like (RecB) superfamily